MKYFPEGEMAPGKEYTDSDDYTGNTTPDYSADAGLDYRRRVTIGDGIAPQGG
jgi:hypothetical protein